MDAKRVCVTPKLRGLAHRLSNSFPRQAAENKAPNQILSDRVCGRRRLAATMNFIARPIAKHQRARLLTWTLAMLMWLLQLICTGAVFSARHERQRSAPMSVHWLTRRVKLLIISCANDLAHARMRRRRFSYRGCRNVLKPGLVNAILGVRVRRMLKRKGAVERIVALVQTLRHIDDYAALVVSGGTTRRASQVIRDVLGVVQAPIVPPTLRQVSHVLCTCHSWMSDWR